jgi:nucleotide-binding universal stress UspA family protein
MQYKKLFFPIGGGEELKERVSGALKVVKHFNAHLEILKSNAKPSKIMNFDNELSDSLLKDLNTLARKQIDNDKHEHEKIFENESKKLDVIISKNFIDNKATAYMNTKSGYRSELIEKYSKYCDIVIVSSPPNGDITSTFESAVTKSGKPALMIPRKMNNFETNKIIIGWNNSPEVSRAITSAIQILQAANEIHIVTSKEYTKDKKDLENLQSYLLHHKIKTTSNMIKTTRIPGEALLKEAKIYKSDLIIAGAFSHKGLKELMFGGTTQYILEHSNIPIFMAH